MLAIDSDGRSGGLMILWNEDFDFEVINYSSSHIHGMIASGSEVENWQWLIGVYGHPKASRRPETWRLLTNLKGRKRELWLILKDFNKILCPSEKVKGKDQPEKQMIEFREMMSDCEVRDLGFVG